MDREAAESNKIKAVITALISRMSVLEQNYITLANQQTQFTTLMNRVELLEKQVYDCTSDITSISDSVNLVKTKIDENGNGQESFLQSLHSSISKQSEAPPKRKGISSSDDPPKKRRNNGGRGMEDSKQIETIDDEPKESKTKEETKEDMNQQYDTTNNHSCSQCDHKAASKRLLEDHIKKNHADKETLYCAKCSYNSVVKQELIDHFRSVHKKPTAAEAGRKEREAKKAAEEAKNSDSNEDNKYNLNNDGQDYSTQHSCSQCKHQAPSKRALEDHIKKTHPEEETLYCAKCSYNSVVKQELIDHFRSVHKKPKENQ